MKIRIGIALIVFATLSILTTFADAESRNEKFSLHLRGGAIQPALNDSSQVWLMSPLFGGGVQYQVSPRIGLILTGYHSLIYDDSVGTSFLRANKDRANRKLSVTDISFGPKFYLSNLIGAAPFVTARIDLLFWNVKDKQSGADEYFLDKNGATKKYSATEAGLTGGIGFEQKIRGRFGYSFSTELTYLTGIGTDFPDYIKNSRSRALVNFSLSAILQIGHNGKSPSANVVEVEPMQEAKPISQPPVTVVKPTLADTTARVQVSAMDSARMALDTDHDGVSDYKDKCANTPSGAVVDSNGCPLDDDSDGVYDGLDKCPHTPAASRGLVDNFGCPLDSDHDGIPDYLDKCANTPTGAKVDSVGCPLDSDGDGVPDGINSCPGTPKGMPVDAHGCLDEEKIFRKRTYRNLFNSGETKLTPQGDSTLDTVVTLLKSFPGVTATIACFTDDLGPAEANLTVSQKRAAAVARYLEIKGISAKRLKALGKGETDFLASNRTKAGREKNRRIEVEFKLPDKSK